MRGMPDLPTGTVTFLFTDIEGSTRLLQQLGEGYRAMQERHHDIVRAAIGEANGHVVRTEGDSFFVAFRSPLDAVGAAVATQRALAESDWPHGEPLRVRMGVHTGEGVAGGDDYIGLDVHRTARVAAAGHGGQILFSDATRGLVDHALPQGVTIRDLGTHRLKDIEHPEHLYDLVIDGLLAEFPPIRTLQGPRTNLPPPRASLVGRDREVAEIRDLLSRARLVTLVGPGGTGKTRLALSVAAEEIDRFDDGVWLVGLGAVTDPGVVPSTIAISLGVREDPAANLVETLADSLRHRDLLLVLDNIEQVIEAATMVDRLLDQAPRLRILTTSRVPLHLSGEHEYHVEPLPVPPPERTGALTTLEMCESVMLFVERAGAVRHGFRLTEGNAAAIADIVRRVDGLPLAIELAARRVKMLTPQALLHRLELRLPLLSGGARDLPERQQTLRGAIAWSHDLLDAEEQRLLARLAAFRGGWTLESAEAMCGPGLATDVLDGLFSLVDQSLVRQEQTWDGDLRFQMLETIHEFATERLRASGEEEQVRRRHVQHLCDLAEEAEPHLMGEGQARWLQRLEREHDNLRAALDWAEVVGDANMALRMSAAIWRFWQQRGHLAEARARLERIMALPGAEVRGALRVRALGALGGIVYWQNHYEAMRRPYEEAVEIAREVGEPRLLARAVFDLSFVPMVTAQDIERTEQLLGEALALAPEDDRVLQAQIWTSLSYLRAIEGSDPAAGIEPIERAVAIHRQVGDRMLTGEALMGLAGLRLLTGEWEAAREQFREAVTIFLEPHSPLMLTIAMFALSFLASRDGDHEQAATLLGAWTRIKDEGGGVPPTFLLAHFFGDPEGEARRALGEEAYERARAEGYSMSPDQARAYALDAAAPTA
jgi:predicted ATPase/class 3 adenylate cyclase